MESPQTIGERIKLIMHAYGMNPNSFSVTISQGPATTDKIIEEKNKPGYEYICAILRAFPRVNARWLLLGIGTIFGK